MNKSLHALDWSLIHAFLAVCEKGSLSAAALHLGVSQPTVGRQIQNMEEALGIAIFARQPRGMVPTPAGLALLGPARAMQEAAHHFALAAAGQEADLAGTVRITASVFVSHHILPTILAQLRESDPQIEIELVPTDSAQNLLFREADIALRMFRPEQLDIVTRQLGEIPIGLFASRRYIARHGWPTTPEDLFAHRMIGFDRDDQIVRTMNQMGFSPPDGYFPVRCDNQLVYWELVRAGCGIGFTQTKVGRADPGVQQILPDLPLPSMPLWIATPSAMRHTPRIERVWTRLSQALSAAIA